LEKYAENNISYRTVILLYNDFMRKSFGYCMITSRSKLVR